MRFLPAFPRQRGIPELHQQQGADNPGGVCTDDGGGQIDQRDLIGINGVFKIQGVGACAQRFPKLFHGCQPLEFAQAPVDHIDKIV